MTSVEFDGVTLSSSKGRLSVFSSGSDGNVAFTSGAHSVKAGLDLIFGVTLVKDSLSALQKPPSDVQAAVSVSNLSFDISSPAASSDLKTKQLLLHSVVRPSPGKNDRTTSYQCQLFTFGSTKDAVAAFSSIRSALEQFASNLSPAAPASDNQTRRRRVAVFVNPNSGTKKASKNWGRYVQPMLQLAGVDYDLMETQRVNHATDAARDFDLDKIDAAITISGDGLLHELMNGLAKHNKNPSAALKLPIGIIPSGTSNGMAKSVEAASVYSSTLAVIKGRVSPLDIMVVTNAEGHHELCNLAIFWGLVADIDIESEKIRWAGFARNYLWAAIRVAALRRYHGRIHFLPTDSAKDEKIEHNPIVEAPANGHATEFDFNKLPHTSHIPLPLPEDYKFDNCWVTVGDVIQFVTAVNAPYIAESVMASPSQRISSGSLDILWSTDMKRMDALKFLLDDSGSLAETGAGSVNKQSVRAFVLEPFGIHGKKSKKSRAAQLASSGNSVVSQASSNSSTPAKKDRTRGILDLDGEEVHCGPIKVELVPGMMNLLVPTWYNITS
ncbi:hypothetical protein GQ42DRAFT_161368 [Ramicandelaber brevisporus]|nr:hypothetical protein GQ42DRAFT_161368 [Ramicandelaber brevisporus]